MSNSDDQLDALYEQTKSDSVSPPEIDARVRAAAHKAIETSPAQEPPADRAWRTRYGWASAAMLMLTTALFVSLPDSTPSFESVAGESQKAKSVNTASPTEMAAPAETVLPHETAEPIEAAAPAPVAAAPTQADERPAKKTIIGFSEQTRPAASGLSTTDLSISELAASEFPTQEDAPVERADAEALSDYGQIEEVVVTGSRASLARSCSSFEGLLIDKVCKEPAADKHSASSSEGGTTEYGYALYATRQSNCAGKKYVLTTTTGEPEPHESSSKTRFVFMPDESATKNSFTPPQPQEMLICKFGRLKLQSFARGR